MPVLLCLITAPIGLCFLLGMSWFEDRVLRPPTSQADRVPTPAPVELLRIVRAPQQLPATAKSPPVPPARPALPRSEDTAA
jgi:hypothetical protein